MVYSGEVTEILELYTMVKILLILVLMFIFYIIKTRYVNYLRGIRDKINWNSPRGRIEIIRMNRKIDRLNGYLFKR